MSLVIALLSALLALSSCAKQPAEPPAEPPRRGFVVPANGTLSLALGTDGVFAPTPMGTPTPEVTQGHSSTERSMLPFPIAMTTASIQPLSGGAVLAINRAGLRRLGVERYAPSDGGSPAETRLVIETLPGSEADFAGRTVAPSWSRGEDALFLLYRHPIFETSEPQDPPSLLLSATLEGARVLQAGIEGDAYAVYPVSVDAWLVQYRSESGDRVETRYARVHANGGQSEPLKRAEFEALASPLPLALAPESLLEAANTLSGSLLIEARLQDGSRRAYVRGDPGQATPAWAWVSNGDEGDEPFGLSACIVTDDWRVVMARRIEDRLMISSVSPSAPVSSAVVRDATFTQGLIVALWEEDFFPAVGQSGLLVIDPGL
ncbi:hypothetical protein MASR2M48_09900 [Spirochaetota bacterium]